VFEEVDIIRVLYQKLEGWLKRSKISRTTAIYQKRTTQLMQRPVSKGGEIGFPKVPFQTAGAFSRFQSGEPDGVRLRCA